MKVAISLCAIASSALTLAAYFGALDFVAKPLAQAAHSKIGGPWDGSRLGDPELFPRGLSEFTGGPTAAS